MELRNRPIGRFFYMMTADGDVDLWRLAKAYFSNNDCNYHQMVSHW